MRNKLPKITEGICEFCGIRAYDCQHYQGLVNPDGSFLSVEKKQQADTQPSISKEENYERELVIRKKTFFNNAYLKDNVKIADIIIPHHTNHRDLMILLAGIDVSIFNIIICAGKSFGENCNKGAKIAETNNLIFINDDVEVSNTQLIKLVNNLGKYDFIGSTQLAGINEIKKYWGIGVFQTEENKFIHSISFTKENTLFPSGFLFGVKKTLWNEIGGFDERFKTGNEDVDFGIKALRSGAKIKMFDLEIRHKECQSVGRFDHIRENEKLIYSIYSQKDLKKLFEYHQ